MQTREEIRKEIDQFGNIVNEIFSKHKFKNDVEELINWGNQLSEKVYGLGDIVSSMKISSSLTRLVRLNNQLNNVFVARVERRRGRLKG